MTAAGGCQVPRRPVTGSGLKRIVARLWIFRGLLNLECFSDFFANTTICLRPSQSLPTLNSIRTLSSNRPLTSQPQIDTKPALPVACWMIQTRSTVSQQPSPQNFNDRKRVSLTLPHSAPIRSLQHAEKASLTVQSTKQVVASTK